MRLSKTALLNFIGILTICTTPVFTDASAEQSYTATKHASQPHIILTN